MLRKLLLAVVVLCLGLLPPAGAGADESDEGWVKLLAGGELSKHFFTKGNWILDKDGVVRLEPREGEKGWQRYDSYLWAKKLYNREPTQ